MKPYKTLIKRKKLLPESASPLLSEAVMKKMDNIVELSSEGLPLTATADPIMIVEPMDKICDDYLDSASVNRTAIMRAMVKEDSRKVGLFTSQLMDKKYADIPISTLARYCGLTPEFIVESVRKTALTCMMGEHFRRGQEVARETVDAALGKDIMCPECRGSTEIYYRPEFDEEGKVIKAGHIEPCVNCNGTGKVHVEGSSDARRVVYETVGLIGKKAIVQINNNHFTGVESIIDDLEKLQTINVTASKD